MNSTMQIENIKICVFVRAVNDFVVREIDSNKCHGYIVQRNRYKLINKLTLSHYGYYFVFFFAPSIWSSDLRRNSCSIHFGIHNLCCFAPHLYCRLMDYLIMILLNFNGCCCYCFCYFPICPGYERTKKNNFHSERCC